MTAPRIELTIDRVVLHGLSVPSKRRLMAALQRELGALFAAQGLSAESPTSRSVERTRGGEIRVGAGGGVDAMATQLARAVHRGVKQ